ARSLALGGALAGFLFVDVLDLDPEAVLDWLVSMNPGYPNRDDEGNFSDCGRRTFGIRLG
ncbi:MAG: hypothetical protein OEV36_08390, partial [Myxococcales bacterium]|nr:hypothetical protein [Myxococcales bacterium]